MAESNLASMSVDALLKLRQDIGNVLSRKATDLKTQLSRLGGEIVGPLKRTQRSSLKGRKVAIKYRGWVWQHVGRKRSTARLAAREA